MEETIFSFIPLEIKILIASKITTEDYTQSPFYKLTYIDEEFRKYSKTKSGNYLFIELFTVRIKGYDYDSYLDIETSYEEIYIFNKLHSVFDEPLIYDGNQHWYKNGELYRDNDLPAVIQADGSQYWYKNGELHRPDPNNKSGHNAQGDLPAVIRADGTQIWYINGKCHREGDLPAIIRADGTQIWYINDKCHREGDLPAVIRADGTSEWYINDKCHRYNPNNKSGHNTQGDLPAIILPDGSQYYYKNGEMFIPPYYKHVIMTKISPCVMGFFVGLIGTVVIIKSFSYIYNNMFFS
jgi:ribosomal protein L24E